MKEHELYGCLLTMHYITVLELVAFYISNSEQHNDTFLSAVANEESHVEQHLLPEPLLGKNVAPSALHSLFYGQVTKSSWKMNPIHCRTTYDPILKHNLRDVVVSGVTGEDLDIMLPRGAQLYNKGWALDLGEGEKKAKKKLERYGGLGYIDSKKAYYGIPASGKLNLFLPCKGRDDILQRMHSTSEKISARECFRNIVVCEVNDKHTTGKECDLNSDISFVVGGAESRNIEPVNATGAFYWGRNICVRVDIPSEAMLTKEESKNGFDIGTSLSISVTSTSVMIRTGACSVSHIVYEQSSNIHLSS